MASIELNILQERELGRLLDYERATCTVDGELSIAAHSRCVLTLICSAS